MKPGASRGLQPTCFGDSCTIDHWYALVDLSRGIDGERYGLTLSKTGGQGRRVSRQCSGHSPQTWRTV
eukprot:12938066-Prorocentrum_lima.AAC.1